MKKPDFLFFGVFVLLVVGCAAQNQPQTYNLDCYKCDKSDATCYKPSGTTQIKPLTATGNRDFYCWARVPTDFNSIMEIKRDGETGSPTNVGKCVEMLEDDNRVYIKCYCNDNSRCIPDYNDQVIWLTTSSTTTTTVPPSTVPSSTVLPPKVAPLYLADGDYGALFVVERTATPLSSSPMTLLVDEVTINLKKAKDNRLRTYLLINKGAQIKFWLHTIDQQGFKDTKVKLNIAGFPLEIKVTQGEKKISLGDRSLDLAKLTVREFKITKDGSLEFLYFGPRDFAPGSKKQTFDIPYLNKEAFLIDITVTQAAEDPPLKFSIYALGMEFAMYKPFVDLTPKPDHETIILLCIAPLVFLFPIAVFIIVHCVYKKVYLKPSREDTSARTSPVDTKRK